jgi:hypothetical protein
MVLLGVLAIAFAASRTSLMEYISAYDNTLCSKPRGKLYLNVPATAKLALLLLHLYSTHRSSFMQPFIKVAAN